MNKRKTTAIAVPLFYIIISWYRAYVLIFVKTGQFVRLQEPVHRSGQTDALDLQLMVRVEKIGSTYYKNHYLFNILLSDK